MIQHPVARPGLRCAIVLLLLAVARPAGAWEFSHAGVDSSGGTPGQFVSMVVDRAGRVHAAWYRDDPFSDGSRNLMYGTKPSLDSGAWTKRLVDGTPSTGSYASISLTADNVPHIAYYNTELYDLKHAWYDSVLAAWRTETVDSPGDVGRYSSIAVDTLGGTLNIAYFDASRPGLKLARKPPGSLWIFSYIDTTGTSGAYASMIFSGVLEVAYYDLLAGNLRYARQSGSAWTIQTVDAPGDVGRYASLAKVGLGAAIAYYDVTNHRLKVADRTSQGDWVTAPVNAAGQPGMGISAAANSARRLGVTYYEAGSADLKYAERFNGTWVFDVVATGGNVGRFSALRYGADNLPALMYYDDTLGRLRYARGRSETTGVPDDPPPSSSPVHPELALLGNPFRGVCAFELVLPARLPVAVRVFDVRGRLVRRVSDGPVNAGRHELSWDGRDDGGLDVASGIYFLTMDAAADRQTRRVVRVR